MPIENETEELSMADLKAIHEENHPVVETPAEVEAREKIEADNVAKGLNPDGTAKDGQTPEQKAEADKLAAMTPDEKTAYEKLSPEEQAKFVPAKLQAAPPEEKETPLPEAVTQHVKELETFVETHTPTIEWADSLLYMLRPKDAEGGGGGHPLEAVSTLLESEGYAGILFTNAELIKEGKVYVLNGKDAQVALDEHKKNHVELTEKEVLKQKVDKFETDAATDAFVNETQSEITKQIGAEIGVDNIKPGSELHKLANSMLSDFYDFEKHPKNAGVSPEVAVAAITVKIVKKYNEMKEKSPIRPQAAGGFKTPTTVKKDESLAQKSDRQRSERISNAFKGLS